ncbi:MAG: PD-(D/E)XK nuclease family protein [Thermoanaerobaculia bacterium]
MSLPVDSLSVSSIRTLRQCPERWRRRYVERHYEPPSGPMVAGKAAGAAEAASDHTWIETDAPLSADDVLDVYSDEFDQATAEEEVDWKGERPATLKDSGAGALRVYHNTLIPETPKPIAVERKAELTVEGELDIEGESGEVVFVAYLDLEVADGTVIDRKLTKQRWSQEKADADLQATAYLAARRAEADSAGAEPASGFAFDAMVRVQKPYAERVPTERTDEQLDDFLGRILGAASEIAWRSETDHWDYAPDGAWWCSERSCGYWSSCPGGGLFRRRASEAARSG